MKKFFIMLTSITLTLFVMNGCSQLLGLQPVQNVNNIQSEDIIEPTDIKTIESKGGAIETDSSEMEEINSLLRQKEDEIRFLKSALERKETDIEQFKKERTMLELKANVQASEQKMSTSVDSSLLPSKAMPGECYARVYQPPVYKTVTEKIMVQKPSEEVQIIPARYEWVKEKVLVKDASVRYETIPADYKWVKERILIKDAHTVWKKGRGSVERLDNGTGEIMCLVKVPATYKTINKKILVKPATVKEIRIPPVYETVKVKKMVVPPQKKVNLIPAKYETVRKRIKVTEGKIVWQRTMCETNINTSIISKIQFALRKAGYNPGPADGVLGPWTREALKNYQKDKRLAIGSITYETLSSLGLDKEIKR